MKTNLPSTIKTIDEAIAFLTELHTNGESFHPEDDATDIAWACEPPSDVDRVRLNQLMNDIHNLPGNDGRHHDLAFDPCEYLIYLDKVKDGFTISNDGVVITLDAYVQANNWMDLASFISNILCLEVDEEWPMPVHYGFTLIKRIN